MTILRVFILGLAVLATYGSLSAPTLPFVWLWAAWVLASLCFGWIARGSTAKAVWFNLCAVFLALAVAEVYFWTIKLEKSNSYCCGEYFVRDDALGAIPHKNVAATHVKTINSIPIYKVTYTINQDGLRIVPPYDETNVLGSVLFFGCSYTMGDGVADRDTMPYQVGLLTNGRYAVYNFGFHGYGPQQMLAALEDGRVRSVVTVPPRHIVYQAIPYHMERVAGLMTWFPHSPRYRRTPDGRVIADGNLDTIVDEGRYSPIERFWRARGSAGLAVSGTLRKSFIYDKLVKPLRSLTREDVTLFLEIIAQAKAAAAAEYPGAEFHVLLWDNMFGKHDYLQYLPQVLDGLRSMQARLHLVSQIIPGYDASIPNVKYQIHQHDSHPNPVTYRLIATYVANSILIQ